MTRPSLHLFAIAMLALCTWSCRNQDGPDEVWPEVEDIVTFEGNNSRGAVLTFNRVDDSPLITLQAQVPLTGEGMTPGTRLLARYRPASGRPYTSGDIELTGTKEINNGPLRIGDLTEFPDWDRDGVYVYSLWRSGSYINLFCRLTYDRQPRVFMLMLDEATEGDPVPQLYLVHTLATDGVNSHDRQAMASFDIANLWDRPGVQAVDIHVANTNLTDAGVFTFAKAPAADQNP